MKNVNLIEMLRGCSKRNGMAVSASNPDGQPTVNRQSRLMSHRGYLRNLAMIFAVLVMSIANIGEMWGANIFSAVANSSSDLSVSSKSQVQFTAAQATVSGGKMYYTVTGTTNRNILDDSQGPSGDKKKTFCFSGNDQYYSVKLNNTINEGDTIYVEIYADKSLWFTASSVASRPSSAPATATSTGTSGAWTAVKYVIAKNSDLDGVDTLHIWRNSGNTYFSSIWIAQKAASCDAAPTAPTAFAKTSVTATTATFSITDAANAASYDIYCSTSSTSPDGETTPTATGLTTKTPTVTSLTSGTTYYAWVRAVCDGSHKSSWLALGTTTFTTLAAPTASFSNSTYAIGGSALDLSSLWSSNSAGSVTYSVEDAAGTGASVSTAAFSATRAGKAKVKAVQAANGSYDAITKYAYITVGSNVVGKHTVTYDLEVNVDKSRIPVTDSVRSTSLYLTTAEADTLKGTGVTYGGGAKSGLTGKISAPASYDGNKYVYVQFSIASGYTFTLDSAWCVVQAVGDGKNQNGKLVISDTDSHSFTGSVIPCPGTKAGTPTHVVVKGDGSTAFTGTVTLKIYVYGSDATYRLGEKINIHGSVAAAAPSCVAPTSATVEPTNANGWRYSLGETIDLTCTAEGGTGTKTYQWQKYIGSTWTDINTATNASAGTAHLQIANCTSSDGGSYRCVVSSGATCSLTSNEYRVYVFTLDGNYYGGGDWVKHPIVWNGANTGTVTLSLTESSTFMYKVTNNDGKWYGGTSGNFLVLPAARDHYTDQTADIRLFTGPAGNYTFTIDITHFNDYPGTPYVNISVAYPTVSHPASGYAYFKKWNDWSGYYIHWWYNDGSDHPLSTWGSDPQVTTETTICGTDYIYFPVLDTYNKLIVKDAAGDASHTTGDLSSVGSSGKYFDFTNNNAWNTFTTYTVTTSILPAGYGTVSAASVTGVACGTSISTSSNTLSVGATNVTATPAAATAEYTYAFANWAWTPAGATVTSDVTATANFTRTPKSYTLTWNLAGGKVTVAGTGAAVNATGTPNSEVAFGTAITAPTVTKTGYTFAGWSSTPASTMPAANTTYTATWTAKTTTITINANTGNHGSTAPSPITATYGSALPSFTAAAGESGYSLTGYFTEATSGTKVINANGTLVASTDYADGSGNWKYETATLTLYPQYESAASLTALVSGTLYKVEDMVPSGTVFGEDDVYKEGLSANTKFFLVGSAGSSTTVKFNNKEENQKTIDGTSFTNSCWFGGEASLTKKTPSTKAIKFELPSAGTLYIYYYDNNTGGAKIKLALEGEDPCWSSTKAAAKATKESLSAGTYYLYATSGSTAIYGIQFDAAVPCTTAPTVTAGSNSSVSSTTATVSCASGISALGTGGCTISSYGFVIGTVTGPTIGGSGVTQHEVGTSYASTGTPFSKDLTGLTAETTYYVRPYATNGFGTAYGTETSFTTTAAPTLYTVTFDSNGGSAQASITQASEDASIEMPSAPTYAGHTFQGWVIGGTTYAAEASYTPTANVTAYASWKETCAGSAGNSVTIVPATGYSNQVEKGSTNVTFTSAPTLDYKYKDENNNTVNNSTDSRKLNNAYGCTIASNSAYRGSIKTTSAYDNVDSISFYFASPSRSSAKVIVLYSTDNFDKDSTTLLSATAIATSNSQFRRKTLALPVAKKANELTFKFRFAPTSSGITSYIDSLKIYRSSGYSCYYVTYNGNGAEAGSISDAEAYASGSNVTVLGNTGGSAFTKTGYRFNGWNTSATGKGTAYAAGGTISSISADMTLYAQWVADACSAPSAPTISGTSVRTAGQTITLNAACASGADASTTYTWYKGETFVGAEQVQAAMTAGEGGRIFNKASCVAGDAGTYWCKASNGDGCEAHNATGFAVAVNAAVATHIYYYKDADHYSDDTYSNPEGNTAASGDNKSLSSPWMICNGCMTGVDSVVAHGATYDGKGNYMNAYIKIPTGGTATTKNIKFALTEGYTGTLTIKIGGYKDNPTVTLQPLTAGVLGSAITPTSGTVGGVATTENNFNAIEWPLATAGGTYVLTVTSKTGYISQIDMTTSTSATFNVTYNGNDNTGGTVPTDATNYASGATVTAAANSGSLVKTNYTGAGWNTANNGTGTNYVPGSGTFKITANTTLYAHWTQLITLAPGTQGTGTNNAAVSWNGSVLRGFAAHTASGYALQGYYTEPSGGTKVLNADGSFAATNIDGFVTSGKWSNTGAAPTLYAQWEASSLLKWNLKVNVAETSITTLSKESAAPTVIAVANMINLTNNGSLTITDNAKSGLTSKIATTASAIDADAGKYMSVQFVVAAGYQLKPSDIKVKVQPISHSQTTKLILEDNYSHSISYTSGSLSKGSTHTVTMTNSEEVAFTGTVTLKIYVYGTAESDGYRLGTPIEINGSVEATCATPPTFGGLSYDATEYTVGASASAISVTGAENVNTYAWKQNDVNDRSGGTAASGTNNTVSYTPPTGTIGTKYYWCEMTNTTCGITIKTPAVGIMVRNVTTDPTVTWSNVKLGATDDVTPNYGGGNYVLRATVEETDWPGTLAASMITAPAGITIHHVTTGKADNKNYIEFKFDVTTAFDRASNATIDFNIALPEAGSYSALNSEKSVTYNDCSGGAAGQVAIKMGATASTSKSNPQNYWETAGAGRLMYNYGGNMGSTNNSSGYKTADSTFYYYAASTGQKWMFQTYIAGVNKVRVVFRAAGTIKSSKATITNFYYNTEYFASPGSNAVSFGDVNANKAGYSSGEDGYIEFTVPEMAANSYGAFVTADGNMKVYGVVLYTENAGGGGSVATNPAWSDSKADEFTVNKTQSDANFTYTISTTTNTLGAISYSSSNPSVAAVDPVTGEVTITATGASAQNATITATLARSGCYQGATRTYTINVAGYSCSEPSGSVELTSGSATKCASESVTLTMTGFTEGADIQWYDGDSPISDGGGYTITTTTTRSTLTTAAAGTYSAIATVAEGCVSGAKRTNSITIANMDMSEQKTVRKVSQWYVKNGRLTPDIALWQLGEGETFKSVAWSPSNATGLDFVTRNGIVYLEGKEPSTNTSADIPYTLTLTITDACGTDHVLSGQTITLTHQKNTDKHVLAFVVNGTAKGGFTEGITAAQTTSVGLYNAIAAQFDVQATNIYSTDDEQKLREYYSQYDILCITDYPNTQTKGVNSKSYVDAIGALIDIRPILTMEAFVSSLPNWKLKGVSGSPKSPSTRQYTMLLQCKDHEIFSGTKLTKVGEGLDALYRVTMVDKNQEEYKTLDANYGDGEHKANEGYQYGKKPALQGFTYTEEMSDNNMLPLGLIDDGAGNNLQVGIERQTEMEARMMVLGINSYAMERLDKDGQTIVINALKYLMKKSAEDISDCSVYFDGSDETDPTNWDNELNWGPSYASLPLPHQEVRILKECVVKDGVVARASGIKIIPSGRINHDTDNASGSLTIEPGGALIVDGKVRAAVAPNYFNATPTTPSNLVLQSNSSAQAALILDNSEGETQATVQMWNPSYWVVEGGKKKKYWSYVAVPIQEADIPNFFWYGFTYLYDETSGWIKKGDGTSLYPFQGIGASLQTGNMETFYGPLATTESQDITLTYTADKGQGMNLIGNSWTAPIQIANFEEGDFGGAAAEVWVFNTGNKNDGHITMADGSAGTTTAGQWQTIPIGVAGLPGYTGLKVIPAMQAFEVNTTTETTLHLDYDRLVRAGRENLNEPMRAPRRSAAKQIEATMRVRVSGELTHTDVYLLKDARFSDGFDNGWDGHYLSGDDRSAQLYAISEEEGKLAFLAQPEIEGTQLGFAPSKHGNEYTISFSYDGDEEYYLNDIKLKTSTLISEDATYSFTYGDGDTNRFYISRTPIDAPQTSTGVDNTGNGEVKARKFIYRDKMYILINGRVYSADGALVK